MVSSIAGHPPPGPSRPDTEDPFRRHILLAVRECLASALPSRRVEQMHQCRIRRDAYRLAWLRRNALAKCTDHRCAGELRHHLRLRPGGLDDMHLGRQSAGAQLKVFGTYTVYCRLAIRTVAAIWQRQSLTAGRTERAAFDLALQEIHRRRADETGDKKVRRTVIQLEWCTDLFDVTGIH